MPVLFVTTAFFILVRNTRKRFSNIILVDQALIFIGWEML